MQSHSTLLTFILTVLPLILNPDDPTSFLLCKVLPLVSPIILLCLQRMKQQYSSSFTFSINCSFSLIIHCYWHSVLILFMWICKINYFTFFSSKNISLLQPTLPLSFLFSQTVMNSFINFPKSFPISTNKTVSSAHTLVFLIILLQSYHITTSQVRSSLLDQQKLLHGRRPD